MKVLVTGANGYLGQGIVSKLLDDGNEVVAADYSSEHIDSRAHIMCCDLFNVEDPYTFFGRPDCVFHLAWRNGFVHNSDSHIEDFYSHYIFLKKLIESGLKKISIMGTMHEIGFYEGSINENTPCNPQSMYGISKNALRNAISLLTKNNGVVFQWLRGFYIVGNTSCGNSIFSKITKAEMEGQELFPFTSGLNQWDFLDYDVFCYQAVSAIEQSQINGIINICSGRPQKLSERVERFIKENGYKIRLDYGKFPDRPYDSKAVWGDNSKIERILSNRIEQE